MGPDPRGYWESGKAVASPFGCGIFLVSFCPEYGLYGGKAAL